MISPGLSVRELHLERAGRTIAVVPVLDIPAASVTAIAGANGSGKSSLMMALAGLLDLRRGRVLLGGQLLHSGRAPAPSANRRRTAFVFQEPYLLNGRVSAHIQAGLKYRRIGRAERRHRAERVAERLGLSRLLDQRVDRLSGGERKLVALSAALVLEPELLFLDEVTANLDDLARRRVLDSVQALVESRGTSVLMATHDLEGIANLADRVLLLEGGRLGATVPCAATEPRNRIPAS